MTTPIYDQVVAELGLPDAVAGTDYDAVVAKAELVLAEEQE